MNLKLTLLTALAVTVAAVPAVTAAPKPDQKLSIEAAPSVVKFGDDLKITGQLTGGTAAQVSGQRVTLERDAYPYDGKFERLRTANTDGVGQYLFALRPITNAKYRTTAKGGVQSPDVIVPVKVAVTRKVSDRTPKRGSRVKFRGTVAPPHDGKVARIQRRTASGWKNIARVRLVDGGDIVSKYSKRVKITKSGAYRVKFNPADGDHATGTSRKVKLTVG